ncbi:hypothetical protein Save01_08877 [Streptomyces avermitilis]|nr:hypothetical protein SAVMC3_02960 [Streptomyces avermitilis]GDY69953.1 hypothetical protein SAV14893_093460 [Streptomyces avermitilis]GDY80217.1 hypothetical protein SAV31267_097020 [Streptomyces avermitilis]
MYMPGPKVTAAVGAVLSAATAVVTNLVTTRWSPALIAAAVVLVIAGAAAAAASAAHGRSDSPPTARLTARRRGHLDRIRVAHGADAAVRIEATGSAAEVSNLEVNIDNAEAIAKATGRGTISNSSIVQRNS